MRARFRRLCAVKDKKGSFILGVSLWISHTLPLCWAALRCSCTALSIMGAGLEKLAGGKMTGRIAKAYLLYHQRRDLRHTDHRRHPVVGWYGGYLCRSGQLRYHDTDAVGRRDHGCKYWYYGNRSVDPHGGYLRRQPVADLDPAQDLCARGGVYRLHFLCVPAQRQKEEHRPDHAGLRHPVYRHEPDGYRRCSLRESAVFRICSSP